MATKRVSITTTCLCINTILANPEHWTGRCRWDSVPSLPAATTTTNDLPKPFVKPALISLNDAMRALEGENIPFSPCHNLSSLWPLHPSIIDLTPPLYFHSTNFTTNNNTTLLLKRHHGVVMPFKHPCWSVPFVNSVRWTRNIPNLWMRCKTVSVSAPRCPIIAHNPPRLILGTNNTFYDLFIYVIVVH